MNAIHIIMATSTSANPHTSPNARIESLARKRKLSAITFLVFGILLIVAGSLLASFERQRFSVSFIVFGGIGIIFAFMYWISAEKILIALRKLNTERMRQARFHAQNSGVINLNSMTPGVFGPYSSYPLPTGLPSYEQSIVHPIGEPIECCLEIPPPYEEAIKPKSNEDMMNNASQHSSSVPIHSISLAVAQSTAAATTAHPTSEEPSNRKRTAPSP